MSNSPNDVPNGFINPTTPTGHWNIQNFQIQQLLSKIQTATIVKVVACSNAGDLSPVGTVDIEPMVNQIDSNGNPTPHTTIFNVPYFRLQGGTDAIIIDPKFGDLGIAVFASRDISKVKKTKAQGNPGSYRQYSFSDAMYFGGLLNGIPTQFIRYSEEGIFVESPKKIDCKVGNNTVVIDTESVKTSVGDNSLLIDSSQMLLTIAGNTLKLNSSGLTHNDVNIGATHSHLDVSNSFPFTGQPVP